MELVIGTPKWSSWSMRPWLVARRAGAAFETTLVPLRAFEASEALLARHSPSRLVPVLNDGGLTIWDSLAICEYLAERCPEAALWPSDPSARALARSAAAEMHSGFVALRNECPMDLTLVTRADLSEATRANVRRIVELWCGLRATHGGQGPFLFGEWCIADAFFTPVASRFQSYGIDLTAFGDADGVAGAYASALLASPEFIAFEAMALS